MRLFPDTLFGRVALALGGGLVLTLAAAFAVLAFTLRAGGPAYPAQIERIAATVAIADRLPAPARLQLGLRGWNHSGPGPGPMEGDACTEEAGGPMPGSVQGQGFPGTWSDSGGSGSPGPGGFPGSEGLPVAGNFPAPGAPGSGPQGFPPSGPDVPPFWGPGPEGHRVPIIWPAPGTVPGPPAVGWRARHLREDLVEALDRVGVEGPVVITGGLSLRDAFFRDGRERGRPHGPPHRDLVAQVRLSDGSWAAVLMPHGRLFGGPGLLPGLVAALAVFSAGLAGMSVWAARRATLPLKRLADAAGALEAAGDPAPVAVTGPREVRQAAHALNEMAARIHRFVEDRTRMLAAISHDLRTMLTRLRLRAEYIDDPEQHDKALKDLAEMEEMLSATLAFARDDARAESRTPVDLAMLLNDLVDDLAEAGLNSTFTGPRSCTVTARPTALRRAFVNLLTNAVVYGGVAEVELTPGPETVTVTVSDRGPGISDDLKEKVFAPFFRVEGSRSRETGGTGLGLSVARDVIRGHGGDVVLSDREGGGLVATVTLPVGAATA